MNNLLDLIKIFSNNNSPSQKEEKVVISKELQEQYPYGEFPIRYTKSGQETIRKQSEKRFSYDEPKEHTIKENNFNIETLLPLIQTLSSGKKQGGNLLQMLTPILFKDNPQMAQLFKLFPQKPKVDIKNDEFFPDTNKVEINSLRKIE